MVVPEDGAGSGYSVNEPSMPTTRRCTMTWCVLAASGISALTVIGPWPTASAAGSIVPLMPPELFSSATVAIGLSR